MTFMDRESQKTVTVRVQNDDTPELMEYFTVHLANPQGGSALISPTKVYIPPSLIAVHTSGISASMINTFHFSQVNL